MMVAWTVFRGNKTDFVVLKSCDISNVSLLLNPQKTCDIALISVKLKNSDTIYPTLNLGEICDIL